MPNIDSIVQNSIRTRMMALIVHQIRRKLDHVIPIPNTKSQAPLPVKLSAMVSYKDPVLSTSAQDPQAKEGSLPIGGSTVCQLQSQEQAGLLDAIDKLRRENIDADIEIPQIVVCGDQSSGKSSLLEAIAQVPFPAGSGAVTMFATELVLRRAPLDAVYASILPSWSRTAKQREVISKFQYRPEKLDRDEFRDLFTLASDHLEAVDQAQGFRYDKLRIEVSGRTQPHLTLIVSSQCLSNFGGDTNRSCVGSARTDSHDDGQTKPRRCRSHTRVDQVLLAETSDHCVGCGECHFRLPSAIGRRSHAKP